MVAELIGQELLMNKNEGLDVTGTGGRSYGQRVGKHEELLYERGHRNISDELPVFKVRLGFCLLPALIGLFPTAASRIDPDRTIVILSWPRVRYQSR